MAETVDCPTCEKELRVPDNLVGQKVRCPSCKQIFVVAELEPNPVEKPPGRKQSPDANRHPPRDEPLPPRR